MKKCKNCHVEKDICEFYPHYRGKDGLHSICKTCKLKIDSLARISKAVSGKEMSQTRANEIIKSLSAQAKKVYSCVPNVEWWTNRQIFSELKRMGVNMPLSIIDQHLCELEGAEIIVRNKSACFSKVQVMRIVEMGNNGKITGISEKMSPTEMINKAIESNKAAIEILKSNILVLEDSYLKIIELEEKIKNQKNQVESDSQYQAFLAFKKVMEVK